MPGLGLARGIGLGSATAQPPRTHGFLPDPNTQRLNLLATQVGGAINKIEIAGTNIKFTTVDGREQTETLPDAQAGTLTAQEITSAVNNGEASHSGSIAGLASGWWYIPSTTDAPDITGRPPKTTASAVLFKQIVSNSAGKRRGIMLYYGQNENDQDTLWVRIKNDTTWGNWNEFPSMAKFVNDMQQLKDSVQNQIAQDKATLSALQQTVTRLTTRLGVDESDLAQLKGRTIPSLQDIQKHLTDQGWGPITAHLTQEEVEKALVAKGWGPLPAQITVDTVKTALEAQGWGPIGKPEPGKGSIQPQIVLPKIWVLFSANLPTDLTGAVTSTTGKVHIRKADSQVERLWVVVESDVAGKVRSIQVGSGLASRWNTRTLTINGQQYTGFHSAGGFTTLDETITVDFG